MPQKKKALRPKKGSTLWVRIVASGREALRELPAVAMDTGCTGGVRARPDGTFMLEAYVREPLLAELRRLGCKVEILADAADELRRKQKQVGKGNRFSGADWIPRGVGKKIREEGKG